MLFSEKLKGFAVAHPCREMTVDGARFRCVVIGPQRGRTLVLLNGGMNTLEMWMDYAEDLSRDYQVLLFDYPQALKTNQALVQGMHGFFQRLGVTRPVFIGASDGGMVAQIYVQKYPGRPAAICPPCLRPRTISRPFAAFWAAWTQEGRHENISLPPEPQGRRGLYGADVPSGLGGDAAGGGRMDV